MLVIGHPSRVEQYLANEGRADAIAWAREVWTNPDRLADFELGRERHPVAVEQELDKLIASRNAAEVY